MRRLLVAAMIAVPLAGVAQQSGAQQPAAEPSGVRVDQVWSRAAMAGHQGAVYLTITDTGAPDMLTGVATPVAGTAGLHETTNDNGVMKMRPVTSLMVAPGKAVALAPGGYHIMLMDLKQPLKEGDSFPVTLTFAKAGQVTVTAIVAKAGAATMPAMGHAGMGDMPMQGGGKQP
jgi:periplasmic copper chaperone A